MNCAVPVQIAASTCAGRQAEPPDVSVVIVNYNGLRFIEDCLDSLQGAFDPFRSEVIVVDNASTDGSRDYLASRSDIHLVPSTVNTGFAGGNNLGVRLARGKFVLLLNNDTVCLTQLAPLLDCMADERCGVAGCIMYRANGCIQPSVGYEHTPLAVILSWLGMGSLGIRWKQVSRVETERRFYRDPHRGVDWVSGACMLIRTDLWRQLGGFDETFFMYCEDVDFCRRMRDAGYGISYTPAAEIRHYEAGGRVWVGRLALLRTVRSYLLFTKKHYGGAAQLALGLALGLVFLARSLTYGILGIGRKAANVRREKCAAYFAAAAYLLRHALGGRVLGDRL